LIYFVLVNHCHTSGNNVPIATPLFEECEDDTHTFEMGTWESSGLLKLQSSITGVKTLCLEAFFISLESYQSVNVENGVALAIWTFAAQVMAKRRARSQIANLTPNH
jgi:hypothetical protein